MLMYNLVKTMRITQRAVEKSMLRIIINGRVRNKGVLLRIEVLKNGKCGKNAMDLLEW